MAGKTNGSSIETDWARAPPKIESFWRRCGNVFYNPEENSCFGRTPKRWAIVVIFYGIFYAVLAAMFSVCMAALFHTLDAKQPMYTLSSSLIGENPGVTYRPIPGGGYGFLLFYRMSNISETDPYTSDLQDFISLYQSERWVADKTGCTAEDQFGYPESPCFFIKVNKIFGWTPEFYDASNLPEDMSEDLKEHIKGLPQEEQKQVWVSCWEERKENSSDTKFEYPWGRGLPASFYPFTNSEGYRSPLVAVKVTPPANRLVVIRCRAWAKNIIYNKSIKDASGYARILLHVEADNSTEVIEDDTSI